MSSPRISKRIREIVEQAKDLETVGKYDEAMVLISGYWLSFSSQPDTSGLNIAEQAEILLRCGCLAGYVGSCKQVTNAQEFAQKMLKEARELFLSLELNERVSECEARLAMTYYRLGSFDEARGWIRAAFQHNLEENTETRLYTHIIEGLILIAEKQYIELVKKCKQLEQIFQSSSYFVLQGDFNNNYAIGLMRVGEKEKAVNRFGLAKHFYEKTKHYLYLGLLENNLAVFHEIESQYVEAHKSAVSARINFKKAGDKTREGYSIDTQAHIFMSEGNYKAALVCADEAVRMLSDGENYCYLANAKQTKSHIEFHLKDYAASLETMIAGVNIASIHVSKSQAEKFIDEYAELQKAGNSL
jgi:tetratricopeptide (TPR) repeat protein